MKNKVNKKEVLKYVLKVSRPFYFNLLVVVGVVFFDGFIWTFRPYLLKILVNKISTSSKAEIFSILFPTLFLFIFLKILSELTWRIHNYIYLTKMLPRFQQKIIEYNVTRVLNQSYNFFQNTFSGKLAHYIVKLCQYIPEIIYISLERFLGQISMYIISIYFLSRVNIKYSFLLIIITIIYVSIVLLFNKSMTNQSKKLAESNSKVTGKITDILSNILSVKLFSNIKKEQNQIYQISNKSVINEKELSLTYLKFVSIIALITIIFEGSFIILLVKDWQLDKVSIGDFGFIIYLNNSILLWLWYNIRQMSEFTQTLGETQQALAYIYSPIDIKDKEKARILNVNKGEIVFKNISFQYENKSEPIFKDFSLTINPKEKIGIVGYSGGGKSTLIKLLLRLFDLQKGKILIDNQDISKVTQDSLRENIAVIPQESILFHRSLLENIKYGNQAASKQDIYDAAKKAHAHNFILKMPNGYDSLVGERGVKISGGQKQRISIARIILKNAPILLLDEATSALDSLTEKSIQDSIDYLMKDKTTIIIAHRLSTLQKMDKILVLDNGKIIEEGSHKELIAKDGHYKKLWNTQINGFLADNRE